MRPVSQIDALDHDGASTHELVTEFRNRFMRAVARCSEPTDALLLSGGIDSSALTCAYTSILGTASGRGYSLTYDHQLGPCDERRFVDDVEHATGISVHRLAGNRLLPLIASFPEGDEPEPWPYASRNWALLHSIAADAGRTPTTVFTGEGGDELLLGQVFSVAARMARGDTAGGTRSPRRSAPLLGVRADGQGRGACTAARRSIRGDPVRPYGRLRRTAGGPRNHSPRPPACRHRPVPRMEPTHARRSLSGSPPKHTPTSTASSPMSSPSSRSSQQQDFSTEQPAAVDVAMDDRAGRDRIARSSAPVGGATRSPRF
ncbi:MAG: asparagine synthase-related protein [Pseudonocardia sp.]